MCSFSFVNENVKLASMELGMFFMFSACFFAGISCFCQNLTKYFF